MSNAERDQLKKANPGSKKWAEQVDKMRPEKVAEVYATLMNFRKGKLKK